MFLHQLTGKLSFIIIFQYITNQITINLTIACVIFVVILKQNQIQCNYFLISNW